MNLPKITETSIYTFVFVPQRMIKYSIFSNVLHEYDKSLKFMHTAVFKEVLKTSILDHWKKFILTICLKKNCHLNSNSSYVLKILSVPSKIYEVTNKMKGLVSKEPDVIEDGCRNFF